MKKIFAILAAATLFVSPLTGCGGDTQADPAKASPVIEASLSTEDKGDSTPDVQYYSQDVDITNSTGVDILELYISTSDVDEWEEDLLNGAVFADGATMEFTTDIPGTVDTTWDILVVDADGDEIDFREINLSSASTLNLHWGDDGLTPTVSINDHIEYYSQDLDITNSTGVAILEVYISPADDNNWGEELLGGSIFEADETLEFTTELQGTADAAWDILIVDEDGDEIIFEDVNFSSATSLTLHWGADGQTPTVSAE